MSFCFSIGQFRPAKIACAVTLAALAVVTLATSACAVTYINGFDVYTGDGAVNWTTVKNAGYQFAFVKATEGVNFIDSRFTTNMNGAHNAGVLVGPYHFTRIESKDGVAFTSYDGNPFPVGSNPYLDATSEAADFIQSIRPFYTSGSYLPPVADVETFPSFGSSTLNRTFVSNWLQLFSDSVQNAIGVRPMIYTSQSAANTYFTSTVAGEHKLWEAVWKGTGTVSPPTQANTPSWPLWTFWQWSDGADSIAEASQVPGTSVSVDRDVFAGTTQQLNALLVHVIPGDYNHDGHVDGTDWTVWHNTRGSIVNLAADGNNNQVVDTGDYTLWLAHVPEPTSATLLATAILAAFARRSRLRD
ncbi:MAG TPA: glycoside hydrolase family 25 protein [Lacipirellulaceae bacterium]|jgi:GH25 family lysozyme M1 (1,4-beta-N-acetylmuramidase)|nr:glycoside hydrolase family 25 protein [Lacipirellulaceae bacterium]